MAYVVILIGFSQLLMWEASHPFTNGDFEQFEYSETVQISFVFLSILMLLIVSRHDVRMRPLALCLAFFLSAVLLRENDWIADYFSQNFLHHVLIYSMLGILIACLVYFRKHLMTSFHAWMLQPSKGYIECGLLTVLVFAQLFGRKTYWTTFMDVSFERWVKNAVEEGVECLGYSLILFGTLELFIACRNRLKSESRCRAEI